MAETAPKQSPEQPLASLTPDQMAALEAGPGLVTNPVASELITPDEYRSAEYRSVNNEFGRRINIDGGLGNFSAFFAPPGTAVTDAYRATPSRQRFAIIYPTFTAQLEELVSEGFTTHLDSSTGYILDPTFIEAYRLMVPLVDRSDPGVLQSDGEVSSLYLLS